MKISACEAMAFYDHPSQQRCAMGLPDVLPDTFEYRACDNVMGAFHPTFWPHIWMVHLAVKPEGWGVSDDIAKQILREFWEEVEPQRIIAWTDIENRAVAAFAKRCGFIEDGRMENVVMWGFKCL